MQLKRVLSAFAKTNVTVVKMGETRYKATKGSVALEFYENGKGSNSVCYFVERSPQTDASTDCFCDTFYNTIKAALARLG
jgi:hypothetical protein